MAVQGHPKYNEWSRALDNLKEANDHYRAARFERHDQRTLDRLRINFEHAQLIFNKIADEIDG